MAIALCVGIVGMCAFCMIVGALEEAWTAAERREAKRARRYRYE